MVRCLTLVDGTAQTGRGDYDNVIAIVDVLDAYRTLAEMARACFGRLGQLLNSDEAREATKFVDWRIMEHALWTLKTYPDDVDIQLVSTIVIVHGRFPNDHDHVHLVCACIIPVDAVTV